MGSYGGTAIISLVTFALERGSLVNANLYYRRGEAVSMKRELTIAEKIEQLIQEQTDLTFERAASSESQRNQKVWESLQKQIEYKGREIQALRQGKPWAERYEEETQAPIKVGNSEPKGLQSKPVRLTKLSTDFEL